MAGRRQIGRHQLRGQHARLPGAGTRSPLPGTEPRPGAARRRRMGEHHLPVTETGAGPGSVTPFPALSVAPMLDVTDRHFRRFVRSISRHVLLYTEMVTEQALRFGPADRLLAFSPEEQLLVLQLVDADAGVPASS